MAYREYGDDVGFVAIKRDISSVAEINQQLAVCDIHILRLSANPQLATE